MKSTTKAFAACALASAGMVAWWDPPAAAAGGSLQYTSCGSGHMIIKSITANPDPIVPGHKETVTVQASVDEKVTGGSYTEAITGPNGFSYSQSGALGQVVHLPLAKGNFQTSRSYLVPSSTPAGDYTEHFQATDQSGMSLVCVDVKSTVQ